MWTLNSIFESPEKRLGIASFQNVRLGSGARASRRGAHFFSVGLVTSRPSDDNENDELPPGSVEQQERVTCVRYATPLAQLGERMAAVIAKCPELDLTAVQVLLTEEALGLEAEDNSSSSSESGAEQEDREPRKQAGLEIASLLKNFYAQLSNSDLLASVSSLRSTSDSSTTRRSLPLSTSNDTLFFLPAAHYGFGPLLPKLVKLLLPEYLGPPTGVPNDHQAGKRVLIYCPPGNPLYTASVFALNLLFILDEVAHRGHSALTELDHAGPSTTRVNRITAPRYRGYLSLHDLMGLEEESRIRTFIPPGTPGATQAKASWVGVTTDRILVERPQIFDVLVDLTNVMASGTSGAVRAGGTAAASQAGVRDFTKENQMAPPTVSLVHSDKAPGKRTLVQANWASADFGNWNGVEERAAELREQYLDDKLARKQQRSTTPTAQSQDGASTEASTQDDHAPRPPGHLPPTLCSLRTRRLSRKPRIMSTIIAFLRYYFAGWGWLSIGFSGPLSVIPLGIRDDGAARASMILLEDDDGGTSSSVERNTEDRQQQGTRALSTHLRRRTREPTDSPLLAAVGVGSLSSRALDSSADDGTPEESEPESDDLSVLDGLASSVLVQAWTEWGVELVSSVGRTLDAACAAASLNVSESSIGPAPVHVHARTLRQLGLDTRDVVDRALTEAIFALVSLSGSELSIYGQWSVFF